MTPFYFGRSDRRLFGVYHASASGKPARAGVVIAAPFGHEAIRVHRFQRLLADRLSRQGVAVLRFDYFGTGDSGGSDEDANLEDWAGDLCEAHRELLRHIGGLPPVTWFSTRLGASVALRAAHRSLPRVHRLVLWDPVVDGHAYLAELGLAQVDELDLAYCIPDAGWRRDLQRDPLAFADESLGFAITPLLREQMLALRPDTPPAMHAPVTVIARERDQAVRQWCDAAGALAPGQVRHAAFEHSLIWTSNPFANNEMAPASALQYMLGELA